MIEKLQMTSFAYELDATTLLIPFEKVTCNVRCNLGLFSLDPYICATNKTTSNYCTFVNTRVLSLFDKESKTTLP